MPSKLVRASSCLARFTLPRARTVQWLLVSLLVSSGASCCSRLRDEKQRFLVKISQMEQRCWRQELSWTSLASFLAREDLWGSEVEKWLGDVTKGRLHVRMNGEPPVDFRNLLTRTLDLLVSVFHLPEIRTCLAKALAG